LQEKRGKNGDWLRKIGDRLLRKAPGRGVPVTAFPIPYLSPVFRLRACSRFSVCIRKRLQERSVLFSSERQETRFSRTARAAMRRAASPGVPFTVGFRCSPVRLPRPFCASGSRGLRLVSRKTPSACVGHGWIGRVRRGAQESRRCRTTYRGRRRRGNHLHEEGRRSNQALRQRSI